MLIHASTCLPLAWRLMTIPDIANCLPVAAMPINSPLCVPRAVQRFTTLSPSAIVSSIEIGESSSLYCGELPEALKTV